MVTGIAQRSAGSSRAQAGAPQTGARAGDEQRLRATRWQPADADEHRSRVDEGRDKFEQFDVNPSMQVAEDPVSTFSADVDTASYSFARRS